MKGLGELGEGELGIAYAVKQDQDVCRGGVIWGCCVVVVVVVVVVVLARVSVS